MKIVAHHDMVNIDNATFSYANIKHMYVTGHGTGIQLDTRMKDKEEKIRELCDDLSDTIYQLQELING